MHDVTVAEKVRSSTNLRIDGRTLFSPPTFVYWLYQQRAALPDFASTALFSKECIFAQNNAFNTHDKHMLEPL
ncbi:hypothetical protein TNIN_261261 [Trichonephila inaurata madagascariensis]|uniref:Uncharacterized protein n=1 Tax=Trichonephila inaurata madagascariensis TaxID=2747483 RepID=A0A8X6JVN5_9ARAC|nr:hypothetical protein TNIN_261261 [Trichonephila inaurata madagascariensis]